MHFIEDKELSLFGVLYPKRRVGHKLSAANNKKDL